MIFGKRKFVLDAGLKIDGQNIEYVDKVKFLGVQIDRKLSWKDHISHTCKKLAKSIGIIAKARLYLCRKTMINLYYTFCYPYLTYCNIVWASTYTSSLDCLVVLQKRIIRLINFMDSRSHTASLYQKLRILDVRQINRLQIGIVMYKYVNSNLPNIFNEKFSINSNIHMYQTRQASNFHIPRYNHTLAQFSICYKGPVIWNDIPSYVKEMKFAQFKKHYKLLLLNSHI